MTTTLTDFIPNIKEYLRAFQEYYPGIDLWFDKVWQESLLGKRRIWVIRVNEELSGVAITKPGLDAKLCHFSLLPSLRQKKLGVYLMRTAIGDLVCTGARTVHVTTSDEVGDQFGGFFRRCGFVYVSYAKNRYRQGSDELIWKASISSLRSYLSIRETIDQPYLSSLTSPFNSTACTEGISEIGQRLAVCSLSSLKHVPDLEPLSLWKTKLHAS
jgi:ribosomal protein S18 acetylase RimI-like enzyme